jgi:hypothetical protein
MSEPITYGEIEARREEEARAAFVAHEQELREMRAVLGTKEGRSVVWRLLSEAGLYRATEPGPIEILAYGAGERNQGQKLLAWVIEADVDAYLEMSRERLGGAKQEKRA